jgi:hypothetical protein
VVVAWGVLWSGWLLWGSVGGSRVPLLLPLLAGLQGRSSLAWHVDVIARKVLASTAAQL